MKNGIKNVFIKFLNYQGSVGVGGALYPKENFITLSELRRMKINKIKRMFKVGDKKFVIGILCYVT